MRIYSYLNKAVHKLKLSLEKTDHKKEQRAGEHVLTLHTYWFYFSDVRPALVQHTERKKMNTGSKLALRVTNVPGRVESFHGLLLIAPARGVLIFTGSPSTGHGALHVTRDDMPQGLSHLGVLCCGDPRMCYSKKKQKKSNNNLTIFVTVYCMLSCR